MNCHKINYFIFILTNSDGVKPVTFLKILLKVAFELNPASNARLSIVYFFIFSGFFNNLLASSTL